MSELQTSNYDEENNQIVRFEELIGSIKPYIEGLKIQDAIPRIIVGIRSYFLSLGESKTKIKEYKNTGEAINLDITKQLPEINEEIKLTDAQIAIAVKDEMIIVYQYIEGAGWLALVEASR
jgi:hypothetical protein